MRNFGTCGRRLYITNQKTAKRNFDLRGETYEGILSILHLTKPLPQTIGDIPLQTALLPQHRSEVCPHCLLKYALNFCTFAKCFNPEICLDEADE